MTPILTETAFWNYEVKGRRLVCFGSTISDVVVVVVACFTCGFCGCWKR
jgi:hypothetical protein